MFISSLNNTTMKHLNQNKMKQTAVDWFQDQIIKIVNGTCELSEIQIFEQAKEMEKNQIITLAAELYEGMYGIDGKEFAIDYYNKLKE